MTTYLADDLATLLIESGLGGIAAAIIAVATAIFGVVLSVYFLTRGLR